MNPQHQYCLPNLDLVTTVQVNLVVLLPGALLRGLALFASADLPAIHIGAVHAAQIADADIWRVDFQQKVMAGHSVIVMQTNVAVQGSSEDECVMLIEDELLARHAPRRHYQCDFRCHNLVILLYPICP